MEMSLKYLLLPERLAISDRCFSRSGALLMELYDCFDILVNGLPLKGELG